VHLFQKFLSSKFNRDTAAANYPIEEALQHSKKPKSGAQSAAIGAETRERVFSIIEMVESEIKQLALAIAQDTGALVIHPKLIEEVRRQFDAEIIDRALYLCFPNPLSRASCSTKSGPPRLQNIKMP
jgi:hypothetical protein